MQIQTFLTPTLGPGNGNNLIGDEDGTGLLSNSESSGHEGYMIFLSADTP